MNPQEERKLVAEIKNIDEYARGHEDDIYRGVWMRSQPEEEMRRRYEGRMEDMRDDFHDWKEAHAGKGEPAVIQELRNMLDNVRKPRGGKKMKKSKGKASKRKGKTMKKRKGKTMKKRKGKTMKKRKGKTMKKRKN
jgi:hypothetical protein